MRSVAFHVAFNVTSNYTNANAGHIIVACTLFVFELFTRMESMKFSSVFFREKEKKKNERRRTTLEFPWKEEEEEYLRTREWRFLPRYSIKFHEIGRISTADSCDRAIMSARVRRQRVLPSVFFQ